MSKKILVDGKTKKEVKNYLKARNIRVSKKSVSKKSGKTYNKPLNNKELIDVYTTTVEKKITKKIPQTPELLTDFYFKNLKKIYKNAYPEIPEKEISDAVEKDLFTSKKITKNTKKFLKNPYKYDFKGIDTALPLDSIRKTVGNEKMTRKQFYEINKFKTIKSVFSVRKEAKEKGITLTIKKNGKRVYKPKKMLLKELGYKFPF